MLVEKAFLEFMQKYLCINSSHPNPDYAKIFLLFEKQAKEDHFFSHMIDLKNGLQAMIIEWEGSDKTLPALALNHHMDVVPVKATNWKFSPFKAIVQDGLLYGRGTQDMKGVGVCHYFALRKLKQENVRLKRSVYLILLPHEEVGGFEGGGVLVETQKFRDLNIGYILDEGLPSGSDQELFVKVSERKPMQITFSCVGKMAHGSRIDSKNATHELILFLAQLAEFQRNQLKINVGVPHGLLLSMNITSFRSGVASGDNVSLNIIPAEAQATVDVRVPPTMLKKDVLAQIHAYLKNYPSITYEINSQAEEREYNANYETDFYKKLTQSIRDNGIDPLPYHAEESSDMRFYLQKGIIGLGISPFTISENLHGIDECVKLSDLELGKEIFYTFVKSFCG